MATVAENGLMRSAAFDSRASSRDGSKAGAARAAPASERTTGPAPWRGSISDSVRFPTFTTKNATVAAPRPQCAKTERWGGAAAFTCNTSLPKCSTKTRATAADGVSAYVRESRAVDASTNVCRATSRAPPAAR